MRKALLSLVLFLLTGHLTAISQGVELVPEAEYENLPSPPIEAGAGQNQRVYSIPKVFFPPPGNQGSNNSCVGWAIGYAYLSFFQMSKNVGGAYATNALLFSPWYVYKNTKLCQDCKCGVRVDIALNFLKQNGNVPFKMYPYDINDCNKPNPSLTSTALKYTIPDWRRVEDMRNLNEIRSYLLSNVPIIAVIKADDRFKAYRDPNEVKPFEWMDAIDFENHAVLIVGYDDDRKAIKILNSHGTKWGTRGYGWVYYESYTKMVKQAFIIQRNSYGLPSMASMNWDKNDMAEVGAGAMDDDIEATGDEDKGEEVISAPNIKKPIIDKATLKLLSTVGSKDFRFSGSSEFIRKDRYHFAFSIHAEPQIAQNILKVVYYYNDPSFIKKFSTSYTAPRFTNSYDGWGCLPNMSALVYLKNDSIVKVDFDGCAVIKNPLINSKTKPERVQITPYVTVKIIAKGKYHFKIELRGIAQISYAVDSVRYDWNHASLKPTTLTSSTNKFSHGYTGWGCLSNLKIIIFYSNRSQKTLEVNMCEQLGWLKE